MDKISDHDFKNDALARKVTRYLLIFEVSALFVGIIFSFFGIVYTLVSLNSIALFIAFVSLVLLLSSIIWLNIRYRSYPIVQEKRKLNQQINSIQAQIQVHSRNIESTHQTREQLHRDENDEMEAALKSLQNKYIQTSMTSTRIADADISGIGPKLKERLAAHGYSTAASINANVTNVEGFGVAKTQAILDWRNKVYSHINATKPVAIPPDDVEAIKKKYEVQHINIDTQEKKHQESKALFEKKLIELQPRINELAPFTFTSFLRHSLASRGIVAAISGAVLIISSLCLGISTTFGAIVESVPTNTKTPTITRTSTNTLTPTITYTLTITFTPTNTLTSTITLTSTNTCTPTITFTPTLTYTSTRTFTPIPSFTINFPPINTPFPTAIQPTQTSQGYCCKHCTNSQPCGDTCISKNKTCHQPPGCACP